MSNNEKKEPILVLNPNTGRWVDVRPLLDLATEFDDPQNHLAEVAVEGYRASRLLIEYAPSDTDAFADLQYSFSCLNKIADAFFAVQEYDTNPYDTNSVE